MAETGLCVDDEQEKLPVQPNVAADVGPDKLWVHDVMLANPDRWAMVTATSGPSPQSPNIHYVLAVDGVVVDTDAGPKGALCSIRSW